MSLCRFALGKALQGQKKHVEAVKEFSEVINKELKDAHATLEGHGRIRQLDYTMKLLVILKLRKH